MPTASAKFPIQFRIGKGLLKRIGQAAWDEGVSRNTWVVEAIQRRLRNPGKTYPSRVSVADIMADRVAIMIRLDGLTLDLLNEATEEDDLDTRTIWILDACVRGLAYQQIKNAASASASRRLQQAVRRPAPQGQ